jgi:purine-binding chemotaxis protein CheW
MEEIKYLTLYIAQEVFALEVLRIKEIIPNSDITYIPLMPPYIKGVMNVRGDIVPILNLAKRVGLDTDIKTHRQSIIILRVVYDNEETNIGIVVSMVNKVFEQKPEELESSPTFGSKIKKDFIKQIAKVDDSFIPILDLDKILNLDELSLTSQEID